VRRRLFALLTPLALASSFLLVTPGPAAAANGMTETGVATYVVDPASQSVKVTVRISDHNQKPNYYYYATQITVEKEAGPISAGSNGGAVTQKVIDSDDWYRYVQINYPNVLYGGTRVVTATYAIPGKPSSPGGYRALSAYASACVVGNGYDTGSVNVVMPAGFDVTFDGGQTMTKAGEKGGLQTYTSGTIANPYKFWSCFYAEDGSRLEKTTVISAGQTFSIESWPEDADWTNAITADVTSDARNLVTLTGMKMPGGTVRVVESGDWSLGQYGGMYDSQTRTIYIPESLDKATVAHELSHIWFNGDLFRDRWIREGLAGFSEQAAGPGNYISCNRPGTYPGSGSPNLSNWIFLDAQSTETDQAIVDWQYAAACYIFTDLAGLMGPTNLLSVFAAVDSGEMAYQGATAHQKASNSTKPISAKRMLDLIDELGMVPGGVKDLNTTQDLLQTYGIFSAADLRARATSRASYHGLVTQAGTWKMPQVLRSAMESWSFSTADELMKTVTEVLDTRDSIAGLVPGLTIDLSAMKTDFESAKSADDLATLLEQVKAEAAAAAKVASAITADGASRDFLESVGLMGTNPKATLETAKTDLAAARPDAATAEAQQVIDLYAKAADDGTGRLAATIGALIGVLAVVLGLVVLRRRGRRPALATAAGWTGMPPAYPPVAGAWPPAPNAAPAPWQQPPSAPWVPNSPDIAAPWQQPASPGIAAPWVVPVEPTVPAVPEPPAPAPTGALPVEPAVALEPAAEPAGAEPPAATDPGT
jgi:hypothetical protein